VEHYVGLDVSLRLTAICIVDGTGKIAREGSVASDPEAIAAFVKSHAPHVARIGLETGATAAWLWTELNKMGLPVICIDARHAKAALKMQINKSDRNDAAGIARIMQCGWYKEVRVKDLDSHAIKALLVSRALLVKIKRDLENQIRGLLKNHGLVIGRAKMNVFAVRAAELTEDRPELAAAVEPLLKAREAVEEQIAHLDRKVMRLARSDAQVRRFMTAPGVGPITALCYLAIIDDPTRFKRSRSVGAYAGLTTRRYASGEIDWTGRISKCGDAMLRSYLYEAANVLLTRVAKWSALKAWASGLPSKGGFAKPKSPWLESSPSFCTGCGSMAPSSNGHRRRLLLNLHNQVIEVPHTSGRRRPCRDGGGGEIALGLAMLKTAKRASHIDPPASSYAIMRRAHVPTAERTLDPARMIAESLTPGPELENDQDPFQTKLPNLACGSMAGNAWEPLGGKFGSQFPSKNCSNPNSGHHDRDAGHTHRPILHFCGCFPSGKAPQNLET
jgi:transposase